MKRCLLVIFVLTLAACSHGPTRESAPTGLKASDFWREQERRQAQTNQIAGKLRLRYKGKKNNIGGAGRWLAQFPNQARLELRDPLGRLAYLVTLEGTNFVAYYPSQKRAFIGGEGGKGYLKQFLGLDARFGDLQRLSLGLVPAAVEKSAGSWEWDEATGTYRANLKAKEGKFVAFVDPKTASLREIAADLGAEKVRVVYEDFDDCCGPLSSDVVSFGNAVRVYMLNAQTQVEVDWEEITPLDKPRGKEVFKADLPQDVRRIPVGE